MAPESATEGRPITQPRPVLVDGTYTSRSGGENGGPVRPNQQEGSFSELLDAINLRRPTAQVYYLLKPDLLSAFSVVGAIDQKYTFKEVLTFLKYYVKLSKLIDHQNPNTVNCKDLPLGRALGVDKFELREVRSLLLQNLIGSPTCCSSDSRYINCPSFSNSSQTVNSLEDRLSKCIYFPPIPEPLSEAESEYSYQGYETALCQSVNSSENESESASDAEEYEVVSEEECTQDSNEIDSDTEAESIILEIWDCNYSDEEFFADESDSSTDSETDVSTEDEKDQWHCVSCGIKNKPFMRYCLKCWELRKDWLPEPPKRRKKRKPRPKKIRKRSHAISHAAMKDLEHGETSDCEKGEDNARSSSENEVILENIVPPNTEERALLERTNSLTSTTSVVSYSTACSSQDSGFGSQEYSSEIIAEASNNVVLNPEHSDSVSVSKSSRRKRKFSEISESESSCMALGKLRRVSGSSDNIVKLRRKLTKYTDTSEGQRWLLSSKVQDVINSVSSESENDQSTVEGNCIVCCARPKNASIIHGKLSHIGLCYPCANKLYKSKQKCPICRRKIHMITRNSYV